MAQTQTVMIAAAVPVVVQCYYLAYGDPTTSAGDFTGRHRGARADKDGVEDGTNVLMVSVNAVPGTPLDVVYRAQQVLTRSVFTKNFVAGGYTPAAYLLPVTSTSTTSTTTTFAIPKVLDNSREPISTTSLAIGIGLAIAMCLALTCGIWYGVQGKKLGEVVQASDLRATLPTALNEKEAAKYSQQAQLRRSMSPAADMYGGGGGGGGGGGQYRVPTSMAYGQGGRTSVSPGKQSGNYLSMGGGGSVYGGLGGSYLGEYTQPEPYARMSPQDTRGLEAMLGTRWSNENERFARPTRYQGNPLAGAMGGGSGIPITRLGGQVAPVNTSPGGEQGYFNVGSIHSPTSSQRPQPPPLGMGSGSIYGNNAVPDFRESSLGEQRVGHSGGLLDEVAFSNLVGSVWDGNGVQYSNMPTRMAPDPLNSAYSTAYSAAPYDGGGEYAGVIGALGGGQGHGSATFDAPQAFVAGGSIRPATAMANDGFMNVAAEGAEVWPTLNDFDGGSGGNTAHEPRASFIHAMQGGGDDSTYMADVELGGDVLSQATVATDTVFKSMDTNADGVLSLGEFRAGTHNQRSEAGVNAAYNGEGGAPALRGSAKEGRRSVSSMMSVEEAEERDLAAQESTKPWTSLRPDEAPFDAHERRGVPRSDSTHFYPVGSSMHQSSVLNAQLNTLM